LVEHHDGAIAAGFLLHREGTAVDHVIAQHRVLLGANEDDLHKLLALAHVLHDKILHPFAALIRISIKSSLGNLHK
jgi:hypothetical protein